MALLTLKLVFLQQIKVYFRVYLHPAHTEPLPPSSYYFYDLGISSRNTRKSPLLQFKTSKLLPNFRLDPYFHISFEPGGRQFMSPFLGVVGK